MLKKNNRSLYDSVIYGATFPFLMHHYFNSNKNNDFLKSGFVQAKVSLQIDNKLYSLGSHLTWYYLDHQNDPVERMKERSVSTVLHQDPFLIEDISKVFKKAILWDKNQETEQSLKDSVALVRYMYAYSMPNFRGYGAIGDWIEMIIYNFHGFTNTHYKPDILPPFEPLACLTLDDYLQRYDETIEVKAPTKPDGQVNLQKILLYGALLTLAISIEQQQIPSLGQGLSIVTPILLLNLLDD